MASTLSSALTKNNFFEVTCNEEEKRFLKKYKQMITKRCKSFLKQSDEITAIDL
jgi:hypothetical protein